MKHTLLKAWALVGLLALGTGCSGGGSSADGGSTGVENITISGQIATASIQSSNDALSLPSSMEIYVIYSSGTTVGIAQADVAGDGSWSFNVPTGSTINAIVRDKETGELVAPITFYDPAVVDMSGEVKQSTVTSFKSGVSLGAITLTDDGKFAVDITTANIAAAQDTAAAPPSSVIDYSGAWTLAKYDKPMSGGYMTACDQGDQSCHGPQVGESIYFVKISGRPFSYSEIGRASCRERV